jgi:hypothetical protein
MNEILQQRIESVQAGRNITHANIEAKRNLREQLEKEVAEFLANGGEIKPAKTHIYKANHGTSDTYKKLGCRCEKCMQWALSVGVAKTTQLRGVNT